MTVLSAEVEEYAGAYMVLTYNDLYEMLAEIHDLVEECRKYAHGTAYITMDGDKNDPWHTIDLNDLQLACGKCPIEYVTERLIHDLIDSWSDSVGDWDTKLGPISSMADMAEKAI